MLVPHATTGFSLGDARHRGALWQGHFRDSARISFPTSMEVFWYVERGGTVSHILAECQPRLWSMSRPIAVPRPVNPVPGAWPPPKRATHTYTRWATPHLLGASVEMRKAETRDASMNLSLPRRSCEGGTLGRAASAAGV